VWLYAAKTHTDNPLVAIRCVGGTGKRTIRATEVEIGNSGADETKELGTKRAKLISGEHRLS